MKIRKFEISIYYVVVLHAPLQSSPRLHSILDLCGAGWSFIENRCIHYSPSFRGSYSSVLSYCQSLGAFLPVLNVPAKSYFAERLLTQGAAWIGLTDSAQEGVWKWNDGSLALYTNWSPGRPNGGSSANCAIVQQPGVVKGWADVSCSATYNAMCEKGNVVYRLLGLLVCFHMAYHICFRLFLFKPIMCVSLNIRILLIIVYGQSKNVMNVVGGGEEFYPQA